MSPDATNPKATSAMGQPLNSQPALILFGRDERGRPYASAFGPADASAAERAASLMGLNALAVLKEHQAFASSLPKGRVFESGRYRVPSYEMPKPPRRVVFPLPNKSQAKPTRGP